MENEAKKSMYDGLHDDLMAAIQNLSELLLNYADSRYKSCALTKVEEAYLWGTQMIHDAIRVQEQADALAKYNEMHQSTEEPVEAQAGEDVDKA